MNLERLSYFDHTIRLFEAHIFLVFNLEATPNEAPLKISVKSAAVSAVQILQIVVRSGRLEIDGLGTVDVRWYIPDSNFKFASSSSICSVAGSLAH